MRYQSSRTPFLLLLATCISTIFNSTCKTRAGEKGAVKDANVLQFGSDSRIVIYEKENNIYAVTCNISEVQAASPDNLDVSFLDRSNCNESKNMYKVLSLNEYKKRLTQVVNFDDAAYKGAKAYMSSDGKKIALLEAEIKRSKDRLAALESGSSASKEEGESKDEQGSGKKFFDNDAIRAERTAIKNLEAEFSEQKAKYAEQSDLIIKHERRRATVDKLVTKLSEPPKDMTEEQKSIYEAENSFMIKSVDGGYLIAPFSDDAMSRWTGPKELNPAERDIYISTAKSREWIVGEPTDNQKFSVAQDFCTSKGARMATNSELTMLSIFGAQVGESDVIAKIGDANVFRLPLKISVDYSMRKSDFRMFSDESPTFRGSAFFSRSQMNDWKSSHLYVSVGEASLGGSFSKNAKNISVCLKGAGEAPVAYYEDNGGNIKTYEKYFLCNAVFPPGRMSELNNAYSQTLGDNRVLKCAGSGPTLEEAKSSINGCVSELQTRLKKGSYPVLSPSGTADQWCKDLIQQL